MPDNGQGGAILLMQYGKGMEICRQSAEAVEDSGCVSGGHGKRITAATY